MKTYCINLDRRPDRWAHMTEQLRAAGLVAERVPAVDASQGDIAAEAARCGPGKNGRKISAGAYACFQSHRAIWRRLVDSGDSFALVVEDDVYLAPDIGHLQAEDWLPPDADMIKLETVGVRVHLQKRGTHQAGSRALLRVRSYHSASAFYAISRVAAQRLLRLTETVTDPVDDVLFKPELAPDPPFVVYQMYPAPAIQGERLAAGRVDAPWMAGSITEHWSEAESGHGKEPIVARVMRRASHELQAMRQGTRYVVVPFA